MKPLVEYKIVTDFKIKITESRILPVFIETASEVERRKKKSLQEKSSKNHRYFLKKYIFKVITDIRQKLK